MIFSAPVVTLEAVVAVIPEAEVAVADRRRLTVLQVEAVVADKVTPAMEDTNTNLNMCSLGETISVLNHVGFHQVSRIGRRKLDLSRRQGSSIRLIGLIDHMLSGNGRRSKRLALIER